MKVSALIITYNQERYIAQAIQGALMQQTNFDFEIVISDDCSTDRTRAIIEDYEARHPDRIRARYSPHNRFDESFVLSYHSCRGEYVVLLEGDDYWTSPEKLQKQADFLDRHPECSMCCHGMLEIREGSGEPPIAFFLPGQKEISTLEDLILHNFVHTSSAMLRKEVFDNHPRWVYDAPFSDYPLWIQAAHHGNIGYIKEFLGVYRIHEGGLWSGKTAISQVEDLIWFHKRIRRELGPGYDHVFERVLARFHGQLACERAGVPGDAVVLVASGGDPELLKVRPAARHFPEGNNGGGGIVAMRDGELVELLEAAREEGGQFLLVPRTAFLWRHGYSGLRRAVPWRHYRGLRRELDSRYTRIWDSRDALLYELLDRTDSTAGARTPMPTTKSWLLPPPVRRFREHLREIRRVAGETQQQVSDVRAALARIEARAEEAQAASAAQHGQVLEVLRFIHSRGQWRRERLREFRASPSYERPFTDPDPLVSVVIPTYDNHRLLRERSIPSVLAQTYQAFEIVVVGDAAPEAARLAVESFNDPRIRFSNLPYRGPYPEDPEVRWRVAGVPPYNEAVRLAQGLWIAPLADDDAFRPEHLERLLAYACNERLELAYARLCQHSAEGGETTSIGRFPPEHAQFGLQSALYHRGLATIFELELADAPFGLPCDWGTCQRMMEAGVRIGMLDEETVDYDPSRVWTPRWEE